MKKSNQILLGGFIVVIVLITAIHISLYAKYKSGQYTIYKPQEKTEVKGMEQFPGVRKVTLVTLQHVQIQFAEQAAVQKGRDGVRYQLYGDSLVISGGPHQQHPLYITIPVAVTIRSVGSMLQFEKGKLMTLPGASIYLDSSIAVFGEADKSIHLQNVQIVATNHSLASFADSSTVQNLEVLLKKSSLECLRADAATLSIITDSLSGISLQAKLLLKAKITTTPD